MCCYLCPRDDEDFNDVATMGGVNLSEESRNILATNSELMSGQLQSCKDETFLHTIPLQNRINAIGQWRKDHKMQGNCNSTSTVWSSYGTVNVLIKTEKRLDHPHGWDTECILKSASDLCFTFATALLCDVMLCYAGLCHGGTRLGIPPPIQVGRGYTSSPCMSVCRQHSFQSITSVGFGIAISNFISMG